MQILRWLQKIELTENADMSEPHHMPNRVLIENTTEEIKINTGEKNEVQNEDMTNNDNGDIKIEETEEA